jgi:hypothetical protein
MAAKKGGGKGAIGVSVIGLLWLILTIVNYVRINDFMNDDTAYGTLTVYGPLARLYSEDNYGVVSLVQGVIAVIVILAGLIPFLLALRNEKALANPGLGGAPIPGYGPGVSPQNTTASPTDPVPPVVQ